MANQHRRKLKRGLFIKQFNGHNSLNIIFKMGCKTVVDNLIVNLKGPTDFHVLLQKYRANLSTLTNSRMNFVKETN